MSVTSQQSVPAAVCADSSFRGASAQEFLQLRQLFVTLVAVLVCVGVQMVHSSSLTSRPGVREEVFLTRHLIFLTGAAAASWMAGRLSPAWLQRNAETLFWCFLLLLILVLVPGVGSRVNGARRWLRLGGLSVQPSELGRIILPLMAATSLTNLRARGAFRFRDTLRLFRPLLLALPLVIVEPDLGATAFLATGFLLVIFLGGWPLRYFLCGAALAGPLITGLLILRPYQLERIKGFLNAWQDLSQAPWQIRQSLLSLGAGGLQGTGIGDGWQKLSYLPEANTDFVFAVIGEELGLGGTITVCLIWIGVLLVGLSMLRAVPRQSFQSLLGTTLLLQLVLQAVVNVAVVTALVPPKGVPHPFISYGGTSLLVSLCSVGLIVGMSRTPNPIDSSVRSAR